MTRQIDIVGGGLAGLTLGIALRQRGIPVQISEAATYPRHRVCGEFISGRGLQVLDRMGLIDLLQSRGGRIAETAAFFSGVRNSGVQRLPSRALCISRYQLDSILADEFQSRGGVLKTHCRQTEFGEGIVRATGRRIQAEVKGWRWFGLKVHARNVALMADLEMHVTRRGYVGLCQLADGVVNVCGLFRSRDAVPDLARNWKNWLVGEAGSMLHNRLCGAVFEETSFCSVAGISLERARAADSVECSVGDAITMIPPVTGNGMSIAFESAELAAGLLERFARGEIGWTTARAFVGRACDEAFQHRLRWASLVQTAMMQPFTAQLLITTATIVPQFWRTLFLRTRD